MNFFHPIQLNCWDLLAQRTREQTQDITSTHTATKRIVLSDTDSESVNQELLARGLPKFRRLLAFRRTHPKFEPSSDNLHVDFFNDNEINKASIVFPIENCENTGQFWYDGEYTVVKWVSPTNTVSFRVEHTRLDLACQVEICNTPMIVRTDIPHSAYCGDSPRLVCTMRFVENIDIDTIKDRMLACK